MSTVKKKFKYVYNYPENKQYSTYLHEGDKQRIAVSLGLSLSYIARILTGERKMPDSVKNLILKYKEINELKDQIQVA